MASSKPSLLPALESNEHQSIMYRLLDLPGLGSNVTAVRVAVVVVVVVAVGDDNVVVVAVVGAIVLFLDDSKLLEVLAWPNLNPLS